MISPLHIRMGIYGLATGLLVASLATSSLHAADWSSWAGPDGSRSNDAGIELIENASDAKVAWVSEADLPRTYADPGSLNSFPITHYCPPVIADGLVYYVYPMPDRTSPLDETSMLKLKNGKRQIDQQKSQRSMRQLGDDVILCLDAKTGRTIWTKTMVSKGVNLIYNANYYSAPIIADGKLYVLGSWLMAYCFDAKSGELLWEEPVEPGRTAWKKHFANWLATDAKKLADDYKSGAAKSHKEHYTLGGLNITSPVLIDGVLICNDSGGRGTRQRGIDGPTHAVGIDATNGEILWQKRGVIGNGRCPLAWHHGDRSYVITPTGGSFSCLEPRTGKVVWTANAHSGTWGNNTLSGDYLVVATGVRKQFGMACYKLKPDGMDQLWALPPSHNGRYFSPVIYRGHAFGFWAEGKKSRSLFAVELESGNIVRETQGASYPLCNSPAAADGRLWFGSANYFNVDPASSDFLASLVAEDKEISPSAKNRLIRDRWTSFSVANGRLYYRAGEKIVCADYRK